MVALPKDFSNNISAYEAQLRASPRDEEMIHTYQAVGAML